MSHRIGNTPIICVQPDEKCELCGKVAECRPYGPNGENVCFDCGMKYEWTTTINMFVKLFGMTPEDAVRRYNEGPQL